jgi:hypothetical protein
VQSYEPRWRKAKQNRRTRTGRDVGAEEPVIGFEPMTNGLQNSWFISEEGFD